MRSAVAGFHHERRLIAAAVPERWSRGTAITRAIVRWGVLGCWSLGWRRLPCRQDLQRHLPEKWVGSVRRKSAFVALLIASMGCAGEASASCVGSIAPGGPCSIGPGGGLSIGPGGGQSIGPGGGLSIGPGGGLSIGPGGGQSIGPGGGLSIGPGGGLSIGPGGGRSIGPGGGLSIGPGGGLSLGPGNNWRQVPGGGMWQGPGVAPQGAPNFGGASQANPGVAPQMTPNYVSAWRPIPDGGTWRELGLSTGIGAIVARDRDIYAGDLQDQDIKGISFEDCITICAKMDGCIAVSWIEKIAGAGLKAQQPGILFFT